MVSSGALNPVRRDIQPDGRIRHWVFVPELDKYLRVVTLADGVTLHNPKKSVEICREPFVLSKVSRPAHGARRNQETAAV